MAIAAADFCSSAGIFALFDQRCPVSTLVQPAAAGNCLRMFCISKEIDRLLVDPVAIKLNLRLETLGNAACYSLSNVITADEKLNLFY